MADSTEFDFSVANQPFRRTFCFKAPEQTISPEVEELLDANRRQQTLKAGTSNMGQAVFKILKDTNLMRLQEQIANKKQEKQFAKLREEMIGRRRQLASDVAEYRESLVVAKDRKRSL